MIEVAARRKPLSTSPPVQCRTRWHAAPALHNSSPMPVATGTRRGHALAFQDLHGCAVGAVTNRQIFMQTFPHQRAFNAFLLQKRSLHLALAPLPVLMAECGGASASLSISASSRLMMASRCSHTTSGTAASISVKASAGSARPNHSRLQAQRLEHDAAVVLQQVAHVRRTLLRYRIDLRSHLRLGVQTLGTARWKFDARWLSPHEHSRRRVSMASIRLFSPFDRLGSGRGSRSRSVVLPGRPNRSHCSTATSTADASRHAAERISSNSRMRFRSSVALARFPSASPTRRSAGSRLKPPCDWAASSRCN